MPDYKLFGGILDSPLIFPELAPTTGLPPRWRLTTVERAPDMSAPVVVGREEVEVGVHVTLTRHDDGLRLTFDDTGIFNISIDGARIEWVRPAAADLAAARKDVLGRVLPVCLHQQGLFALHGSAVELGGVAIAFLAPKFHGKSTTAAALVDSGARFLADDVVAVSTGPTPSVLPSVPLLSLWKDSAARVAPEAMNVPGDEGSPKLQRRWDDAGRNADSAAPLAAVYLLTPIAPDSPGGVTRTRLSGVEATLALLGHAKVGNLLGVQRRAGLLITAGEMADRVPAYRLELPRDFQRLPDLTAAMWRWHAPSHRDSSTQGMP